MTLLAAELPIGCLEKKLQVTVNTYKYMIDCLDSAQN